MTGVVYLLFLDTIFAPCSIVLLIASSFLLSVECRLIEISSVLLYFLFFSDVVGLCLLSVISVGLLGITVPSLKRGVSVVALFVISVEISMSSRTGG